MMRGRRPTMTKPDLPGGERVQIQVLTNDRIAVVGRALTSALQGDRLRALQFFPDGGGLVVEVTAAGDDIDAGNLVEFCGGDSASPIDQPRFDEILQSDAAHKIGHRPCPGTTRERVTCPEEDCIRIGGHLDRNVRHVDAAGREWGPGEDLPAEDRGPARFHGTDDDFEGAPPAFCDKCPAPEEDHFRVYGGLGGMSVTCPKPAARRMTEEELKQFPEDDGWSWLCLKCCASHGTPCMLDGANRDGDKVCRFCGVVPQPAEDETALEAWAETEKYLFTSEGKLVRNDVMGDLVKASALHEARREIETLREERKRLDGLAAQYIERSSVLEKANEEVTRIANERREELGIWETWADEQTLNCGQHKTSDDTRRAIVEAFVAMVDEKGEASAEAERLRLELAAATNGKTAGIVQSEAVRILKEEAEAERKISEGLRETVGEYRRDLKVAEAELAEMKEATTGDDEQRARAQSAEAELAEVRETLRVERDEAQAEASDQLRQIAELKTKVGNQTANIAGLNRRSERLTSERDDARGEIADAKTAGGYLDLKTRAEKAEAKLVDLEARVERMRQSRNQVEIRLHEEIAKSAALGERVLEFESRPRCDLVGTAHVCCAHTPTAEETAADGMERPPHVGDCTPDGCAIGCATNHPSKEEPAAEPEQEIVYWDCDDGAELLEHSDIGDAIGAFLDDYGSPGMTPEAFLKALEDLGELEVFGYRRMEVTAGPGHCLDALLELLDENYRGPDSDATGATASMQAAEATFLAAVIAEYTPWACEQFTSEKVDPVAWVKENRSDWLEPTAEPEHPFPELKQVVDAIAPDQPAEPERCTEKIEDCNERMVDCGKTMPCPDHPAAQHDEEDEEDDACSWGGCDVYCGGSGCGCGCHGTDGESGDE